MARPKKEKIKQRPDGRFRVMYHGKAFYSNISSDDAIAQREEYKRQEKSGFMKNQTVAEYALPWLIRTYPAVAKSTYTGLAIHLQHLVDSIGNMKLSEVIPSNIKEVYSEHYAKLSNSYIRSAKQLYCSLFDSAVADGLCRSNPARDKSAKPHRGNKPKEKILTKQKRIWVETLCTDHRTHAAVMAMLYAGIRPQEMKAIDIDRDVDFERNTITVRETAHLDGQSYEYTSDGKTDWSNRIIPLFPPLKKALIGKHGFLITSAHGKRVTQQTWKTAWESYVTCMETAINGVQKRWYGRKREDKKILEAGGKLPAWIEFDIVPYTLRHAFCQMCRDMGVELNTCRRWMGHADTKMILKVYDAVSEDRSEDERKKVEMKLVKGQNEGQKKEGSPGAVENKGVEKNEPGGC